MLSEISKTDKCGNLLAVHLNDLGINYDVLIADDIEMLFNIVNENVNEKSDLFKAVIKYLKKVRGVNYIKNKADSFNYVQVVQEAIYSKDRCYGPEKSMHYNILMGMHMQIVYE